MRAHAHLPFFFFLKASENFSQSFVFTISAAPGVKLVPTSAGVVIAQTAQVYQPHIIAQPAVQVKCTSLLIL